MIYLACRNLIERGKVEGLSEKMGLLILVGQLTNEEYSELMAMLTGEEGAQSLSA